MIQYALTHEPKDDDAMAYTLDGYIKYDEKKFDEAIEAFKKATPMDSPLKPTIFLTSNARSFIVMSSPTPIFTKPDSL